MRRHAAKIGTAAILLAATAEAGHGADLPREPYRVAPPYPTYNWVGPYIGANLGFQWGTATNSGASPSGLMGGIGGGYNWQIGDVVLGAEADLQLSAASDRFAAWQFSNEWFGTVRGRVGYAISNVMVFATFGFAYGGGTIDMGGLSESHLHLGWAAGGGLEVGLTPNWSAKAEYLFVDLSDQRYVLFGNSGFQSSILRLGVNYRF
jgi:outer membrane immunogenic protein